MVPERALDSALRFALCGEQDVPALMRFIGTEWRAGHVFSRDERLLRWQFAQRTSHFSISALTRAHVRPLPA